MKAQAMIGCIYGGSSSSSPSEKPFSNPADVQTAVGFGADAADMKRGFIDPHITNAPEYDRANYVDRWSLPRTSDQDENGTPVQEDFDFRMKDRETKGFLTRPHYPSER